MCSSAVLWLYKGSISGLKISVTDLHEMDHQSGISVNGTWTELITTWKALFIHTAVQLQKKV